MDISTDATKTVHGDSASTRIHTKVISKHSEAAHNEVSGECQTCSQKERGATLKGCVRKLRDTVEVWA